MSTTIQHDAAKGVGETTDFIRTGCYALTVTFGPEQEAAMRALLIRSIGRDCVCEGQGCWMFDAALLLMAAQPAIAKAGGAR